MDLHQLLSNLENGAVASALVRAAAGNPSPNDRTPQASASLTSNASALPSQFQAVLQTAQQTRIMDPNERLNPENLHIAISSLLQKQGGQMQPQQQQAAACLSQVSSTTTATCSLGPSASGSPLGPLLGGIVQQTNSNLQGMQSARADQTQQQPSASQIAPLLAELLSNPAPAAAHPAQASLITQLADLIERKKEQEQEEERRHEKASAGLAALLLEQQRLVEQQQQQPQAENASTNHLQELLSILQKPNSAPQGQAQLRQEQQGTPRQESSSSFLNNFLKADGSVLSTAAVAAQASVPGMVTSDSASSEASVPVPRVVAVPEKKRRRGRSGSFPQKIHQMLNDLDAQGRQDIASFVRDGTAFCIHRTKEFAEDIMPKYFKMSSYASFQRQLNLYDFQRIGEGPFRGSYCHDLFIQGKPLLSTTMKRKAVKKPTAASLN